MFYIHFHIYLRLVKMKNTFILFLLTTYLISTTSWSIGVHECAGEESYSIFGINLNFKCECDHSDREHKNCCTDDKILLKADTKDKIAKKENDFKKLSFEGVVSFYKIIYEYKSLISNSGLVNYEIPTGHSPPLYILFRVFRI